MADWVSNSSAQVDDAGPSQSSVHYKSPVRYHREVCFTFFLVLVDPVLRFLTDKYF